MISSLSILLAQSYPNISGVDGDFVKNFLLMTAFIGTLGLTGYMSYHKGRKQSGSSTEPVHVAQPMHVQPSEAHAVSQALKEIRAEIATLKDSGRERELRIKDEIHAMHKDLRDRMEPIASKQAGHESTMTWLKDQLRQIWEAITHLRKKQSDDIRGAHGRIDDVVRMGSSKK